MKQPSDQVVAQLKRRGWVAQAGDGGTDATTRAAKEWALEDLLEPGGRGRAHAAARAGNASARRALNALARAVDDINNGSGGDAA